MTLVEVMAAGAVLSVLVLCLANAWTVFDRLSFGLLLRQKAAFVLNGEVERLSALYATTAFGSDTWTGTNGYSLLSRLAGSDSNRRVYATNSTGVGFATASLATFLAASTADTRVLVTGAGTARQNWVWLDYPRGLVARLSWTECAVSSTTTSSCWQQAATAPAPGGTANAFKCFSYAGSSAVSACQLVTVVLEYPFRVTRATGGNTAAGPTLVAAPGTALSPSSTPASGPLPPPAVLTLSTIVGRRA